MKLFSFLSSAVFGPLLAETASVLSSESSDGCFSSVISGVSFSLVGKIEPSVLSSSVDVLSVELSSFEHLPPA